MKLPPMRSSDIFGLVRGKIALINAVHIGDPGIKPIELTTQFLNALGATVEHYLANVLAFVDYRVLSVRSLLNWAVQSWRKQIVSSF